MGEKSAERGRERGQLSTQHIMQHYSHVYTGMDSRDYIHEYIIVYWSSIIMQDYIIHTC